MEKSVIRGDVNKAYDACSHLIEQIEGKAEPHYLLKEESEEKLKQLIADGIKYNPMLNSVQIEAYSMGFKSAINWVIKHLEL